MMISTGTKPFLFTSNLSMKPGSKRYTFAEGMFCDLFTKLSVNITSIGKALKFLYNYSI
jgi:hypothetical protein